MVKSLVCPYWDPEFESRVDSGTNVGILLELFLVFFGFIPFPPTFSSCSSLPSCHSIFSFINSFHVILELILG